MNKNKKLKHKQRIKWRNENKERMVIDGFYLEQAKVLKSKKKSVKQTTENIKYKSQSKNKLCGILQKNK